MRWMFAIGLLICLSACQSTSSLPASETPPTPNWQSINFNLALHATVLALANDPTRPRTLYAATYDNIGMYRSDDAGQTWNADNSKLPRSPVFTLLPMERELFAGTADGLYRRSWNANYWQRDDPVPQVAVYGLARDAAGAFYVATDGRGVWKSDDAGTTWSRLPGLEDESLLSVLPLDAHTVMVGTGGHGMFLTRDVGKTWSNVPTFQNQYVSFIVTDPRDTNTIYARARNGLYRSNDAGASWRELDGGIQKEIVNALWFDETKIFAATSSSGIYISEDNGANWRAASVENPRRRAILSLLRVGKTLFAGTFDGLASSNDDGETWRITGQGLGVPLVHDLALDVQNNRLFAATEDGLFVRAADTNFTKVELPINDVPMLSVTIAPNDAQRIYIGTDGKGVLVSDDGGKTWAAAGGDLGGKTHVPQIAVDPTNPENVFARILFERIYASSDGGDNWQTVWTGMPHEEQVQTMEIATSDPQRMYAGGDTQFFASDDGGQTWQARGLDGISTLALWIDPDDANHIIAGATDGVYVSSDAGHSWQGPALNGISVTAITRDANGALLFGTQYNGVFLSRDMKTFAPYGLDDMSVNQLLFDATRKKIYALTSAGLFELDE